MADINFSDISESIEEKKLDTHLEGRKLSPEAETKKELDKDISSYLKGDEKDEISEDITKVGNIEETPDNPINNNVGECNSTYEERISKTPSIKDIDDFDFYGYWDGKRGESSFTLNESIAYEGNDGMKVMDSVEYKDGIPDFSPYAEETVQIDNMSENRDGKDGNYEQCDSACAEEWNTVAKDGKDDWNARDVKTWRKEHDYTWHERNDMKTCDLVPTEVNDSFGHLGGVSECKKANSIVEDYDE